MKRIFVIPKDIRSLFILQAIVFFILGFSVLLLLDPKEVDVHLSGVEVYVIPIAAAFMLAFALGSWLAIRARTRHEVELLVKVTIAFYAISTLILATTIVAQKSTVASWISFLTFVAGGSAWLVAYFKHSKEVRRPGINIKEF
jgi:hypothetical protein